MPTGLVIDEVLGFRRFGTNEYHADAPAGVIRCEHYSEGCYRRGAEVWPRFSLSKLLADEQFLMAGEAPKARSA